MDNLILLKNNLVWTPKSSGPKATNDVLGTILHNLVYYGYVPSCNLYNTLRTLNNSSIQQWWGIYEPILQEVTGDNKEMGKYVVYKNFPKECLDMSQAEYWIKQTLIYIGIPSELLSEEEVERNKLFEDVKLKVLNLANNDSLQSILNNLCKLPARWTEEQELFVDYLSNKFNVNINEIPFKENMVRVVAKTFMTVEYHISATDVLRLGTYLSEGDVTLRTNTKFKSFKRAVRYRLLSLLESSSNLAEDVARDKNKWKKFLYSLHPSDYKKFVTVNHVYDELYNNKLKTINSSIEQGLLTNNQNVLSILKQRPGEFLRRLVHSVNKFGNKAANDFISIIPKLKNIQLLKISKHLESLNNRKYRLFPPKGDWSKLKVETNQCKIPITINNKILKSIYNEVSSRINSKFKSGIDLCESSKFIKLQTNDSELTDYGRGTVFPIPDNIKFIRTASYWNHPDSYVIWFDNGWNFFDSNWNYRNTCCWTKTNIEGAVFSGDPINKMNGGKACQMIDLYPEELLKHNIRYAVWNILCYSRVKFCNSEVYAALQWGEEPQKGELFEPSRCQLNFPVTGNCLSKYIAYIDLLEKKLIYIDANFQATVSSAERNGAKIANIMPPYLEYLDSLPSVYDLFKNCKPNTKGTKILYSDENTKVTEQAYVFRKFNKNNKFEQINLSELL